MLYQRGSPELIAHSNECATTRLQTASDDHDRLFSKTKRAHADRDSRTRKLGPLFEFFTVSSSETPNRDRCGSRSANAPDVRVHSGAWVTPGVAGKESRAITGERLQREPSRDRPRSYRPCTPSRTMCPHCERSCGLLGSTRHRRSPRPQMIGEETMTTIKPWWCDVFEHQRIMLGQSADEVAQDANGFLDETR